MLVNIENLNDMNEENYSKIVEKIEGTLTSWASRGLTLLGKVQVVKFINWLAFGVQDAKSTTD